MSDLSWQVTDARPAAREAQRAEAVDQARTEQQRLAEDVADAEAFAVLLKDLAAELRARRVKPTRARQRLPGYNVLAAGEHRRAWRVRRRNRRFAGWALELPYSHGLWIDMHGRRWTDDFYGVAKTAARPDLRKRRRAGDPSPVAVVDLVDGSRDARGWPLSPLPEHVIRTADGFRLRYQLARRDLDAVPVDEDYVALLAHAVAARS